MLKKTEFDSGRSFYSTKVNLVSSLPIFPQRKADLADFLVESMSLHKLTHQESYTQKLRASNTAKISKCMEISLHQTCKVLNTVSKHWEKGNLQRYPSGALKENFRFAKISVFV